jgi:phage terminase small subunit
MARGKLTPKRDRFAQEYCVDLNGRQAAIRAGYSPQTATVKASQLRTLPCVREAIRAYKCQSIARVEAWFRREHMAGVTGGAKCYEKLTFRA